MRPARIAPPAVLNFTTVETPWLAAHGLDGVLLTRERLFLVVPSLYAAIAAKRGRDLRPLLADAKLVTIDTPADAPADVRELVERAVAAMPRPAASVPTPPESDAARPRRPEQPTPQADEAAARSARASQSDAAPLS